MPKIEKVWRTFLSSLGAVMLIYSLVEAFTGNRKQITYILILVSVGAVFAGLSKIAFAESSVPKIPKYKFQWLAKLALFLLGIIFLFTTICLLSSINVVPDCLGCAPTKTPTATLTPSPTPTASFTPSPTPTATLTPSPTPTPIEVTLPVFSAAFPFASTGISVHAGDNVEITAKGWWDCGRGTPASPDGYLGELYSDTLLKSAAPCALIGAISSTIPDENFDQYFLVGRQTTWTATEDGKLYLGCNDSIGRFNDNPTDSRIEVRIVISH